MAVIRGHGIKAYPRLSRTYVGQGEGLVSHCDFSLGITSHNEAR